MGGSHIISRFEEFVFYFKYNGKLVEGFKQECEKIIQALLPRTDYRMITEGSSGSAAVIQVVWTKACGLRRL